MPAKLKQVHRKLLGNQLNHCVGIRMQESLVRNEWPWAIQRASHVTQTMANEWVTDTQHLDMLLWAACENAQTGSIKKEEIFASLFGWIQSVGSKSSAENVCRTKCLCARWMKLGRKKERLFFSALNCVCEGFFCFLFYISLSALRETEGGRKYCWMVKQHDCAVVGLCCFFS